MPSTVELRSQLEKLASSEKKETEFEAGFDAFCKEAGVDPVLVKQALGMGGRMAVGGLGGAGVGGLVGALAGDPEDRKRNAIIGALLGGGAGAAGGYGYDALIHHILKKKMQERSTAGKAYAAERGLIVDPRDIEAAHSAPVVRSMSDRLGLLDALGGSTVDLPLLPQYKVKGSVPSPTTEEMREPVFSSLRTHATGKGFEGQRLPTETELNAYVEALRDMGKAGLEHL